MFIDLIRLIFVVAASIRNLSIPRISDLRFENNACSEWYDYPIWFLSKNCYVNPDVTLNTPEIVTRHGYQLATYEVPTADGYILTLFRVPPKGASNNKTVFLQHGIASDSSAWVGIGNQSLAFVLADAGYDVWLGNVRGTRYSRKHKTLNDTMKEYWSFNLDDMATNDIRASLFAISEAIGRNGTIIYIGHSMGTTLLFMYASQNVEEAGSLIQGVVAMSPVVYFDVTYYFRPIFRELPAITRLLTYFKSDNKRKSKGVGQILCKLFPYFCKLIVNIEFGQSDQFKPDELLKYYGDSPDSPNLKELEHYGQLYNSGRLQKFDYGPLKNFKKYGQHEPPLYYLSNITLPVFLFYGQTDTIISNRSVHQVYEELGSNRKAIYSVPLNEEKDVQFNHVDFTFGEFVKELFYDDLLDFLEHEFK